MSKLTGFLHPAVVEILNFDSLDLLNLAGGWTHGSHAYTLIKTNRTFIQSSYRAHHGGGEGLKLLVANDETDFKILIFRAYQKIVKLRDSQKGTVGKRQIQLVQRNQNRMLVSGYSRQWATSEFKSQSIQCHGHKLQEQLFDLF